MDVHFCVLGSGSLGNSALLMTPDLHVLIDMGFLPDELAARLDGTGAAWETLDAVVLTHTHGDHLKKRCLTFCIEHDIQLVCHEHHVEQLRGGRYFKRLHERGLVRTYDGVAEFDVVARTNGAGARSRLRFRPIRVPHDCPPTFGFKITAEVTGQGAVLKNDQSSFKEEPAPYPNGAVLTPDPSPLTPAVRTVKLGYLVDLGTCHHEIAQSVADVDLLALEFNHDEQLELRSGRHPKLIQRVLSDDGHLSNKQAAEVFRRVLEHNGNGGPKLLVQMHLSQDCNRAELAYDAAQQVVLLTGAQTKVFSTRQERRGTIHVL